MVNMLPLVKDMNHDVDDEEQGETLKLWGIGCQAQVIKGHFLYKIMIIYYQMMIPTIVHLMNLRKI